MEILEDLYYGNIAPFERTVRRSKEYNKLMELLVRHEGTLNECWANGQAKRNPQKV